MKCSVSHRVIFKQGAYELLITSAFWLKKHYLLLTFQSAPCWEIPYWSKAFQVLFYKQRITAHSVTEVTVALVVFYACAIIVHAHFRDFSIRAERPVVIMLRGNTEMA